MCGNDFRVPIPSHSHNFVLITIYNSWPWEILDYSQIPISSRKVIPIPSHSYSHWNKKSF